MFYAYAWLVVSFFCLLLSFYHFAKHLDNECRAGVVGWLVTYHQNRMFDHVFWHQVPTKSSRDPNSWPVRTTSVGSFSIWSIVLNGWCLMNDEWLISCYLQPNFSYLTWIRIYVVYIYLHTYTHSLYNHENAYSLGWKLSSKGLQQSYIHYLYNSIQWPRPGVVESCDTPIRKAWSLWVLPSSPSIQSTMQKRIINQSWCDRRNCHILNCSCLFS